jgi:hypothetical protein
MHKAVTAWGKSTPLTAPQTYTNNNFHAIESGVSPRQKTLHLYHAYNFNNLSQLSPQYAWPLLNVFEPLRSLYCRLTEREIGWADEHQGAKLKPQVIQYPRGGGYFATHVHPRNPQQIGFILSLSKRGVDFRGGAAGFETSDGVAVDTSEFHDLGDIILFRFDLRHWVSPVDIEDSLDLNRNDGRWVVTLPLN